MSEAMVKVAEKLKNLRESILNGVTNDEEVIKSKLNAIRELAEESGVNFMINDDEYIQHLRDSSIGEESEEEDSSSEEEDYD